MTTSMSAARWRARRALPSLVVALVALAACGGGDDPSKVASEGGEEGTTTSVGSDAGSEADGSSVDAGDAASTTTPGATPGAGGGAAATSTSASSGGAPAAGIPAEGSYRYHTTGTSKIGAQPSEKVDEETVTTLTDLGGGKVRQASEGQEAVLEWTESAVLLHRLDLTQPGFERHFEATPPLQYAPRPLKVGQTWTWKLTAAGQPTTIAQDSRTDRTERVTVGGTTYDTIVVVTKVTLSGDVSGTVDLTQWIDVATENPVRVHAKTDITTFMFKSDTTSDFTGFTPA